MKKILKNALYILLVIVAYSFPIWFIIGLLPIAYAFPLGGDAYWTALYIQIGGLVGAIISGGALWYKWEHYR